jgi:hypothetical protein
MAFLNTDPPPRLPDPPREYTTGYFAALLNTLRLYFNRLFGTLRGLLGADGGIYLQNPHAMLMSNQDQLSLGITSENLVTYNQPIITQGVEVRSNSQIWFDHPGQYLVTFSLLFTNRGNNEQIIEVWAKDNGNNYPLSNTRFDIPARKSNSVWSHAVATITGIFTVDDPSNKYLQIAWWSDGADVFLEHYAGGTSPTRPEIPSVILTVNFVSRLPS